MPDRYIEQVLNGDKEAFRFIIREYKDDAYNLAISIVKEEYAAKEVVQKSFINAYEGLPEFRKEAAFKTWFHRIVVNESYQLLRSRKPDRNHPFNEEQHIDVSKNSVHQAIDEQHKRHCIRTVLKAMKPDESLALRLFYLYEYSIKEVCEITGWSNSNTKVILHRARSSMREKLSKNFNLKPEDV